MLASVGATAIMTTGAAAKTDQKTAQYQDQPKDGKMCGGCSQFTSPDGCKIVDGKISANGWCQLFTPKAG